nr:hypothetical protein [Tanacetum cinerariifolium]
PDRIAHPLERPAFTAAQRRGGRADRLSRQHRRPRRAPVVPGADQLAQPQPAAAELRSGLRRPCPRGRPRPHRCAQRAGRSPRSQIHSPADPRHSSLLQTRQPAQLRRRRALRAGTGGGAGRRNHRKSPRPGGAGTIAGGRGTGAGRRTGDLSGV